MRSTVPIRLALLITLLAAKAGAAEPPPDAQVIAQAATELWKTKKITELERYLTGLSQKFPNRLSAVVGGAFLDQVYRSDYDQAAAKLDRIVDVVNANQIAVSDDFRLQLAAQSQAMKATSKKMTEVGISKEQKKREANATQMREYFGSRLPDLLILLQLASNADLP